ncbi:PqiC family protein [Variovorax sp. J2P1-59]|uniref:PqiC family protein n=1 Tax=Variovorax flavidus TaxID=3053501 RepID=UPI002577784A|nr:PqiC family protein [Variovorax sp. J2P1-59]MDM0073522.1 PqiC family protein [Variovorax sp. J2P1-59]
MRSTNFRGVAAALGAALLMAGCASSTGPQYYSLADTAVPARTQVAAIGSPGYIELAPIAMPERFARPQMVVRKKGTPESPAVDILEDHRWSSSFESELRDALGSGIASRLGAVDVTKTGRQRGQPATRIAVQLGQFDAVEGSRVDASFTWTVRRTDEGPVTGCQLSLSEPVGSGFDALAQGAQRVTAKLADAIAGSVAALKANQAPRCAA